MFIRTKTHKKILESIEKTNRDVAKRYGEIIEDLREKLEEAKDLKSILESLTNKYVNFSSGFAYLNGFNNNVALPDNVATYEADILGGKVIKQEATKCIIIKKDGSITEGITKQKPDKGYTYKLVRE